jgi:hypothetical protein
MRLPWIVAALLLALPPFARADEPRKDAKPVAVPYRLTDTHHVMVRVKLNGKGPFNFIVDTGCPVLIVSTPVAEKIGLKADARHWAVLDKLELEGGLTQDKVKARIETPFQIEGMNSMGLPGMELHGLMGYTVLAKYRMEFDFTRDRLAWCPLAFDPPPPQPLGGKAPTGGLEAMAGLMKVLSFFAGLKPAPPPVPRGFFGFEVAEKDNQVVVARVLPDTPAESAGLKAGDRIRQVDGKDVKSAGQLFTAAAKLTPGRTLNLRVTRGDQPQDVTITAGKGL